MSRAEQVIAEARPMLTQFLEDVGLHQPGAPLDLERYLEPFSDWVDAQQIEEGDVFYLASRLGAYISEYLIDHASASRVVVDGKIFIRMPIAEGVAREFDPYAVAIGMVRDRSSLKTFLRTLRA